MENSIFNIIKNYNVHVENIIQQPNLINNKINNIVDKIFVINLTKDIIKKNYILLLMKKYNFNFTFVNVPLISNETYNLCNNKRITKGELGCTISHLWCLNQIILNKYKNAIIFEDDIILHKNFTNLFLQLDITKFDFLLLGAHDMNFSKLNYKNVKNNLYLPDKNSKKLFGAHANYYSLKGAKRMFNIRTSLISFFDKEYMLMFNHYENRSAICYPNLVVSNISTSSLNHEHQICSEIEDEYYTKCFKNFQFNDYNFIYINILLPLLPLEKVEPNLPLDLKVNLKQKSKINLYESYITNCIYEYCHDFKKIKLIKKRFVLDFFTIDDIINLKL